MEELPHPDSPHQPRRFDFARRAVVHATPHRVLVRRRARKRIPHLHGEALLKELAHVARAGFKLTVWQWLPGRVGGHSANSLHKQHWPDGVGKAFDAFGPAMPRFARFLRLYAPQIDEGIFNPGLSRKNGQNVDPSFWGAETWRAHRNHVHVGNDGPAD